MLKRADTKVLLADGKVPSLLGLQGDRGVFADESRVAATVGGTFKLEHSHVEEDRTKRWRSHDRPTSH